MIAFAAVVLVAAAIVSLVLVQRVQTDPLQVGASQVARSSADSQFDTPADLSLEGRGVLAYEPFYGLRTVVEAPSGVGSDDECMTIYQPELLDTSDGGYYYSGELFLRACAAGVFPAAVTFTVPDESPEALRDAYPVGTPLQFVYDRNDREVVVFRG